MLSAEYARSGTAKTSDSMQVPAVDEVHRNDHSSRCTVKSRQSVVPASDTSLRRLPLLTRRVPATARDRRRRRIERHSSFCPEINWRVVSRRERRRVEDARRVGNQIS